MANIEKIVEALEYCTSHYGCWGDSECPWIEECRRDSNSLKKEILELLKERVK